MKTPKRRGVYPGSFNPPTTAHLAIAQVARQTHHLDQVLWAVSRVALDKESVRVPHFDDRLEVLRSAAAEVDWLEVMVTDAQLVVDIAAGFDVVIMGADKWHQINETRFYASAAARDAAISALPTVAIAPRSGATVPAELELRIDGFQDVSSTQARDGDRDAMLPAAARFDVESGAWTDPARYRAWSKTRGVGS